MASGAQVISPSQTGLKIRIDWNPYLMGAGIGVLSWLVFAIVDDPLGITTALSAVAGEAAIPFLGADAVANNSYWRQNPFVLNYGLLFLAGVIPGALASALASGRFRIETVPEVWRARFGGSVSRRFFFAFLGGAALMYGARLAGGCTSGHSISGGLQLALSSWVFTVVMFATALAAGMLLFRSR
jgi:uncharacterized membrane protein YedE/YeeE